MVVFVAAVILAGLFGPWLISLALAGTAGVVWVACRRGPNDRSGLL